MAETKIGTVIHYYTHLHVAAVKITDGELRRGDRIHVLGHTSNFNQTVESMEIEHQSVEVALPGQTVGLRMVEHAREHDIVYKVA